MGVLSQQGLILRIAMSHLESLDTTCYDLGPLIAKYQGCGREGNPTCFKVFLNLTSIPQTTESCFNQHQFTYMQMSMNMGMDYFLYFIKLA